MPPPRRNVTQASAQMIIGALAAAALSACGSAGGSTGAVAAPTGTSSPIVTSVTPTRLPMDQCTGQLEYWAEQMIADFDNPGWDYQHMGLTATKYDALREIVRGAQEAGDSLAPTWVEDQIATACSSILANSPSPSDAVGWP